MINGVNYEVFGQYWETRNSWGHRAYFLKDGEKQTQANIRYYNRTWESYRFQSVGVDAVSRAQTEMQRQIFDTYKWSTGAKRLTADTKAKLLQDSPKYQALCKVMDGLRTQRR